MSKKKKGLDINGWVILDKPKDMGSTQAVACVKRLFNANKAGHAGTLDPFADGMLPIALGEATKTISFIQDAVKEYVFSVRWGIATDTLDKTGTIVAKDGICPVESDILAILPQFIGHIDQVPPKYSAIKVNGKRAYDLARKGEEVELKSRKVCIENLQILHHSAPITEFRMRCRKGVYVRSIARDMALALHTIAHVQQLRRTNNGVFTQDMLILLDNLKKMSHTELEQKALHPLRLALDGIPVLSLDGSEVLKVRNGQALSLDQLNKVQAIKNINADHFMLLLEESTQNPVALGQCEAGKIWPKRVFVGL